MSIFSKWAKKEYPIKTRLIALIPAGVLFVFLIPYLLAFAAPAIDRRLGLPSVSLGFWSLAAGMILILIGVVYALWSISSQLFQAQGTPIPVMATQKLLVTAPFNQCRNPMTFGTMMIYLGVGFIAGSISALVIVILLGVLLVIYIKRIEEIELEERFGEAYRAYKSQTPFIIPRITRHSR